MRAERSALEEIEGIGSVVAESIRAFFTNDKRIDLVRKLQDKGVRILYDKKKSIGDLAGKTFVLTGTLATLSRTEAKKKIEERGGKAAGSVTGKTDYIVAGEASGSKLEKGRKLGIPVLDENTFLAMLSEISI